uniref:Pancreatic trypsin inhibitor n=1 Tax=Rhipicephalus zambeziensis TaxID=60191 RepID=A0A224Y254_9ACAR
MKLRASAFLQLACVIHVQVSCFLETKNVPINRCMERRDQGPCRAAKLRWYFDRNALQCKEFTYGGCKGNNNNFLSEAECKYACSRFIGIKNATIPCMQKPDTGRCRAYVLKWYFDVVDRVCKMFVYGGCEGNNNRFDSELQCQASCAPTSSDKGICSLAERQEPCNALAQLWYFDHVENTCHRFPPGYCGNSANKFATCRKCMRRCSGADAHKECSLAYRKIHYKKYGVYWPGKGEPRVRGPGIPLPNHTITEMPQINVPGIFGTVPGGARLPTPTLKTTTIAETGEGRNGHAETVVSPAASGMGRLFNRTRGLTGHGIRAPTSSGSALAETTQGGPASLGSGLREINLTEPALTGHGHATPLLPRPQIRPVSAKPSRAVPSVGANGIYPSWTRTPLSSQPQPGVGLPGLSAAGPTITPRNPRGPGIPGTEKSPSLTGTDWPRPLGRETRPLVSTLPATPTLAPVEEGHSHGEILVRGSALKTPPLTIPIQFLPIQGLKKG